MLCDKQKVPECVSPWSSSRCTPHCVGAALGISSHEKIVKEMKSRSSSKLHIKIYFDFNAIFLQKKKL